MVWSLASVFVQELLGTVKKSSKSFRHEDSALEKELV